MNPVLIWTSVFVVSMLVLVKSADIFTASSVRLGEWMRLPSFLVGVLIVAAGTSLPELCSSVFAVWQGAPEIVSGNVIGSNVTNILLVIGLSSCYAGRLMFSRKSLAMDLWLLAGVTTLLVLFSIDGRIVLWEGLVCLGAMVYYIWYVLTGEGRISEELHAEQGGQRPEMIEIIKVIVTFLLATGAIYVSSSFTVRSVVVLGEILGVGPQVIAAGAVALGTSLPELTVSITAVRKGEGDIAVGNVLGSNIFNSLAVIGIPSLLGVLPVTVEMLKLGLPVMVAATLYFTYIVKDRHVTRLEGFVALAGYGFFLTCLFSMF